MRLSLLLAPAFAALLMSAPAMAQHAAHGAAPAAVATARTIEISGAFARATLPNAPVAGGYLTLTNIGTEDDRLVSASAPIAGVTQLHEMKMDGDVMRMAELADGIVVPAGQTVTLAPRGLHVMFMQLTGALTEGETFPLTLSFEKGGEVTVEVAVAGVAASEPAHGEGHK